MAESNPIEPNKVQIAKNRFPNVSRARSKQANAIAKVMKKAATIAELLTEDDQFENLRVIREAKKATIRWYNPETKKAEKLPDTKARLAGAVLDLAYREGKPVERQVVAHVNADDKQTLEAQLLASPQLIDQMQKIIDTARAKTGKMKPAVVNSVLTLDQSRDSDRGESGSGETS